MWKVRVETTDGKVKEFTALDAYALTEDQKLLWKRVVEDQPEIETEDERVTNMRIKTISEENLRYEQNGSS